MRSEVDTETEHLDGGVGRREEVECSLQAPYDELDLIGSNVGAAEGERQVRGKALEIARRAYFCRLGC